MAPQGVRKPLYAACPVIILVGWLLTDNFSLASQPSNQLNTVQAAPKTAVSMMLHKVVTGKDGKQYYLDRNSKPHELPGSGVDQGKPLAVFTGSQGHQWYVDRGGNAIDLTSGNPPSVAQPISTIAASAPVQPNVPEGSFSINNQVYNPEPVTQSENFSAPGSIDETAASELGLTANALQAAADMATSNYAMPYDEPLYWGTDGSPYWWGANGARNYIPRNLANNGLLRNWGNEQGRYQKDTAPFGRYYGRPGAASQPAFSHPENISSFPSLFSQPMLSGMDDGRDTGRYTGRDTGSYTGKDTGSYTGRNTGRYTGQYTGEPARAEGLGGLQGLGNGRSFPGSSAQGEGNRAGGFHGRRR